MFENMLTIYCLMLFSQYFMNGRRMSCNDFMVVEQLQVARCNSYLLDRFRLVIPIDRKATVSAWGILWCVVTIWVACCKYGTSRFAYNCIVEKHLNAVLTLVFYCMIMSTVYGAFTNHNAALVEYFKLFARLQWGIMWLWWGVRKFVIFGLGCAWWWVLFHIDYLANLYNFAFCLVLFGN